ncbi:hypothetical protein LJC36_02880 [Desulfovibrio sp. OttesenSCG-928-C14]|nr:hypothetical protein [Desulfovibrio sp. OttesenSCG-928-C14]
MNPLRRKIIEICFKFMFVPLHLKGKQVFCGLVRGENIKNNDEQHNDAENNADKGKQVILKTLAQIQAGLFLVFNSFQPICKKRNHGGPIRKTLFHRIL